MTQQARLGSALTATELTALTMAAAGATALELAYESGRSLAAVKDHRKRVCRKLGAHNMPHAVALALRAGLIE